MSFAEFCAHPDPGKYKEMRCNLCGAKCNVTRNAYGPTCFAAAMGKSKRKHDCFSCPNNGTDWHHEVYELIHERHNMKSKSLRSLILEDINEILAENHCTILDKESVWW